MEIDCSVLLFPLVDEGVSDLIAERDSEEGSAVLMQFAKRKHKMSESFERPYLCHQASYPAGS